MTETDTLGTDLANKTTIKPQSISNGDILKLNSRKLHRYTMGSRIMEFAWYTNLNHRVILVEGHDRTTKRPIRFHESVLSQAALSI